MTEKEYLDSIDTQSNVYFLFKHIRSQRADYFFKDEKGISAYKVAKHFSHYKNPILVFNGMHLCDHIPMNGITELEWEKCVKVYNNACARRKRLKERLSEFDGYLYFVTLTFTYEQLNMTSLSRRNHIINPLLKLLKDKHGLVAYVGVKEYGKKTDREHYHFLMCFSSPLQGEVCISTKYGKNRPREFLKNTVIEQNYSAIVNVSTVNSGNESAVANYVAKVGGYLDKDSGKTQHLIYSANFKPKKKLVIETDDDGFMIIPDGDFLEDLFGTL